MNFIFIRFSFISKDRRDKMIALIMINRLNFVKQTSKFKLSK